LNAKSSHSESPNAAKTVADGREDRHFEPIPAFHACRSLGHSCSDAQLLAEEEVPFMDMDMGASALAMLGHMRSHCSGMSGGLAGSAKAPPDTSEEAHRVEAD
jgi:hypothetical protein